jgi:hypothetical protein
MAALRTVELRPSPRVFRMPRGSRALVAIHQWWGFRLSLKGLAPMEGDHSLASIPSDPPDQNIPFRRQGQ